MEVICLEEEAFYVLLEKESTTSKSKSALVSPLSSQEHNIIAMKNT